MISFVPEKLKADLMDAITKLHFLEGDIEEIEFDIFEKTDESADEYDFEITENSTVCLHIGEDNYPQITVSEFFGDGKMQNALKDK